MDPSIPRPAGDHRHLQQIIAGLTEGVILIEPDQTIRWANEAALAMHGAKTLDELGGTVHAYRSKFKLTYRNQHSLSEGDYPIDRVLTGETFDEVVVEVTRADREDDQWVHQIRSLVLTTVTQEPELLVLVIEDVTDRFDAEDRFERTFNANPAPAVICRLADLRYVKVNRGFLQMTGFPRHEVIGRSVYEIDVLADAEKREQAVTCLREGHTIEQQEAHIPIAGGGRKFVVVAGQPIELAEQEAMLFTFIDLEPRKKVEHALRHSEERFAKAFKLAPVPMAISSVDGMLFLDVNEAYASVTGYSHIELLGRSTTELGLWDDGSAHRALQLHFDKAGTVRSYEIKLRTKSGAVLDCLISAETATILDKPCILSAIQDISERKRSETELFAAIEAVMQDSSWFSQKVIEKMANIRQPQGTNRPRSGLDNLTDRELEVLGLLCTGVTDRDIAAQFGVSPHTVRNHVSAIYEKIGVHRRGAAVAWARDRGLGAAKTPPSRPRRKS